MSVSAAQFSGKVALITGASSGIGSATARLFRRLGATVVLTGRNKERLEVVAGDKSDAPERSLCIAADVTNESDVKSMVETAMKHTADRLDILVNCAGVLEKGTIEQTSLEQYDRVMNINMRSIYHITMLCVPYLIKTKGNVVNVSSVNGVRSFPGVLAYNVSKAAVDQFSRSIALELAVHQVRVNCVNPGVTVTELHKRGGMDQEEYAKFLEHSKSTHALGRAGEAGEVAQAIAYLASDGASFITGVSLPVDGGRHAMCPR